MGSSIPKQYLMLGEQRVVEHAIGRLLFHPRISGVWVAVAPGDAWWAETRLAAHPGVRVTAGGSERAHSVLRALDSLAAEAADEDWVLVHDAARPCLTTEDIDKLVETVSDDAVGGVLGVRVLDTIKHVDASGRVDSTVPRDGLWRAFTPQMFRLGPLRRALADAVGEGILVTDEASAMELGGCRPRMVEGRPDNIKVTRPADLPLAAFYLRQQEGAC